MPSPEMRRCVARKMCQLLAPGRIIVWHDFRAGNPSDPFTTPIRLRYIRELFPDYELAAETVTLAPPLARTLASRSEILCLALEKVPLLRTHTLATLRRRAAAQSSDTSAS